MLGQVQTWLVMKLIISEVCWGSSSLVRGKAQSRPRRRQAGDEQLAETSSYK